MLELVLSSFAGLAVAATIRRVPRSKSSASVRANAIELQMERDILTKTIARLHRADAELPTPKRNMLLARYQRHLGEVVSRMELLGAGSTDAVAKENRLHDRLASLDQSIAQINNRLHEMSSDLQKRGKEQGSAAKPVVRAEQEAETPNMPLNNMEIDDGGKEPIRVVTGTSARTSQLAATKPETPVVPSKKQPQKAKPSKPEGAARPQMAAIPVESKASGAPGPQMADGEHQHSAAGAADPDDDISDAALEKIKQEITRSLSKLNEAEVE